MSTKDVSLMTCKELQAGGTVAIVGAGPAGAMLARLLQTRGFSVQVFERDGSPASRSQGGSLDLRKDAGQLAMDKAGLSETFRQASRSEANVFKMLDSEGSPHPAGGAETHEDAGPEIDRGDLRRLLLDSLAPGTVAYGHFVKDVHPEADGRWRLEFAEQGPVTADLVVGADGGGSLVRPRYFGLTMLSANIRKEQWRGSQIAELVGEGSVMFAGGGKTIFVQRCARDLILLYYSMAVAEDWPVAEGFALDDNKAVLEAIGAAYRDWSPKVMTMLTQVEGKFQRWPLSVMPLDCRWETRPGLTMVGDSSHVMPPFTGKGVNLALLDALQLADCLTAEPAAAVTAAVESFEMSMQERTRKEIGECLEVGRNIYGIDLDFGRP